MFFLKTGLWRYESLSFLPPIPTRLVEQLLQPLPLDHEVLQVLHALLGALAKHVVPEDRAEGGKSKIVCTVVRTQ